MKKIVGIISGIVIILMLGGGYYWYSQVKVPHDKAVDAFEKVTAERQKENKTFDEQIAKSQAILDEKKTPLNPETQTTLQTSIASATEGKKKIPSIPKKTEEIISTTKKLQTSFDYSELEKKLTDSSSAFQNSVKQLDQVTNPTSSFVIDRISTIDTIADILAVTENNDPNHSLNKAGGYTGAIFFTSKNLDQAQFESKGTTSIDKGTEAGGSIEVYLDKKSAEKRNEYLATFDGNSFINSGSHSIVGTVLVRTSDKLTATQQKELEKQIISALTKLK